jgi:predicted nucleic acid-binding protein
VRYADTSALIPLYHAEALSLPVAQAVAAGDPPLVFTWLHEIEFQNALQLKHFRGECDAATIHSTLQAIRADAVAGVLRRAEPAWGEVFRQALTLSRDHSAALGTRSLDVLHVAAAVVCRATHFITCDQRQSKLALVAGLPVTCIP